VISDRDVVAGIAGIVALHSPLETADALSDSFAQLGELLGSEHKQSNSKDHQQMQGLKESFEHSFPQESFSIVTAKPVP